MLHYVTLTSQGQITIPADVRRLLKLKKQNTLIMETYKDKITITPEADILSLKGVFKTKKRIPFKKIREEFGNYMASRHLNAYK